MLWQSRHVLHRCMCSGYCKMGDVCLVSAVGRRYLKYVNLVCWWTRRAASQSCE